MIEKILNRILLASASCKAYELVNPSMEDVKEFNAYKKCYEIVQEVAKEYGDGWIPCSERLPEPYKKVLVYEEDGEIYMAKYHADIKRFSHVRSAWCVRENEVVAWMPLPIAPYQKGE